MIRRKRTKSDTVRRGAAKPALAGTHGPRACGQPPPHSACPPALAGCRGSPPTSSHSLNSSLSSLSHISVHRDHSECDSWPSSPAADPPPTVPLREPADPRLFLNHRLPSPARWHVEPPSPQGTAGDIVFSVTIPPTPPSPKDTAHMGRRAGSRHHDGPRRQPDNAASPLDESRAASRPRPRTQNTQIQTIPAEPIDDFLRAVESRIPRNSLPISPPPPIPLVSPPSTPASTPSTQDVSEDDYDEDDDEDDDDDCPRPIPALDLSGSNLSSEDTGLENSFERQIRRYIPAPQLWSSHQWRSVQTAATTDPAPQSSGCDAKTKPHRPTLSRPATARSPQDDVREYGEHLARGRGREVRVVRHTHSEPRLDTSLTPLAGLLRDVCSEAALPPLPSHSPRPSLTPSVPILPTLTEDKPPIAPNTRICRPRHLSLSSSPHHHHSTARSAPTLETRWLPPAALTPATTPSEDSSGEAPVSRAFGVVCPEMCVPMCVSVL
ncbi:uncharacterized protein LOC135106399 [Scylla paramamosain]|uniref:uncharacterized protein LOC135106399 n=1 Tax=Scylla paramamosain TaxID=85552 RepID=UPI0030836A94